MDADDTVPPRFPMSSVRAVTDVVARLLGDLRPTTVMSCPANGADLIVLGEAQRLAIDTHVVLPLPVDLFRRFSVDHAAPTWVERYERVLAVARERPGSTVDEVDLRVDADWYLRALDLLLDRARAARTGDEPIVALTVRPPAGQDPPSVTDTFAARAAAGGFTVLTVDPRPGASTSIEAR